MQVNSTSSPLLPRFPLVVAGTAMVLATFQMGQYFQSPCIAAGTGAQLLPISSSNSELGKFDSKFIFFTAGVGDEQTEYARETNEQERTIAMLRGWKKYPANWDHEMAKAPNPISLQSAISFISSLSNEFMMPEPMLHDTGRAGLFWGEDQLYADLEFLENGSIAYYIERGKDRHKGVVEFDKRNIPPVLKPLLTA